MVVNVRDGDTIVLEVGRGFWSLIEASGGSAARRKPVMRALRKRRRVTGKSIYL